MIETVHNLFVGSQDDVPEAEAKGFYIVHACKEPWHRKIIGYTGRALPKTHPEYLFALRPDRMALNLVDVADVAYIHPTLVDAALLTIRDQLAEGKSVLVHCNQGRSRAPSLALLYLARYTDKLSADHGSALIEFKRLYPDYAPAQGMADYVRLNWPKYAHERTAA